MGIPGPGQVLQFANKAKDDRWSERNPRTSGILDALAWVLGDQKQHPLTQEQTNEPPDMKAISEAAKKAKTAVKDDPKLNPEYYEGVRECLTWIDGSNWRKPRL